MKFVRVKGREIKNCCKMKHRVIKRHSDTVLEIELLAENDDQKSWVSSMTEQVDSYLTMNLGALRLIEARPPFFVIKTTKPNIG
jgi:hypothetical protein